MANTKRTKVQRIPSRGFYDKDTIYQVLDNNFICHIGFNHQDAPVVIPTMYGRKENNIFFHGSIASRLLKSLSEGIQLSCSIARVTGIVLARSAFNHSLNYESVVLFGLAKEITDESKKLQALKCISDQALPGRWEEARLPNQNELKATSVLQMSIDEASAKIRTGPPSDKKEDYALDIWAGVLPIEQIYKQPVPDEKMDKDLEVPDSVRNVIS